MTTNLEQLIKDEQAKHAAKLRKLREQAAREEQEGLCVLLALSSNTSLSASLSIASTLPRLSSRSVWHGRSGFEPLALVNSSRLLPTPVREVSRNDDGHATNSPLDGEHCAARCCSCDSAGAAECASLGSHRCCTAAGGNLPLARNERSE